MAKGYWKRRNDPLESAWQGWDDDGTDEEIENVQFYTDIDYLEAKAAEDGYYYCYGCKRWVHSKDQNEHNHFD